MKQQPMRFAIMLLCGLLLAVGCKPQSSPNASHVEPVAAETEPVKYEGPPLTEFALTASDGAEFRSADLAGKVWVASFFFTRCASNCRALNMEVAKLQREYGPRGLEILSISCDPQFDTPAVLAEYAQMYNAQPDQWQFLTGDLAYIQRVGDDMFELPIKKQWHEDTVVVVDGEGKLRGNFHVRQPEQFERLRKLLDELLGPPPA